MILLLLCLASGTTNPALLPRAYHLGTPVVLPEVLDETYDGGRFRIRVSRQARGPEARELLAIAERIYPDQERVLTVARDAGDREHLTRLATGVAPSVYKVVPRAAGSPSDRWWLDGFDATWLPFAVTGGAVDYYIQRMRDLAAGRSQFEFSPGEPRDRGEFSYTATVEAIADGIASSKVEMTIRWSYYCGRMCALWFSHTRSVLFDAHGKVMIVEGDGRPEVTVS